MKEYRFYVPIVRATGRQLHERRQWDRFQSYLVDTFGGFTEGSTVVGKQQNDRGVVDQTAVEYTVSTDDPNREILLGLVDVIKRLFDQPSVYVAIGDSQIL